MTNMNTKASLPSFWKFVWMLFMQPWSLHFLLKDAGIDSRESIWVLLKEKDNKQVINTYLGYLAVVLFIAMPVLSFLIALLFQIFGIEIDWSRNINSVVYGIFLGALGVVFGSNVLVSTGVISGIIFSFFNGIVISGIYEYPSATFSYLIFGATYGAVAGTFAISFRIRIVIGIGLSVFFALFALFFGDIIQGIVTGAGVLFTFFRLWIYPLELALQLLAFLSKKPTQSLLRSPIFYHDLSYLPYPFLSQLIEKSALTAPLFARKALDQCAITLGQKRIGEKTLVRLQIKELQNYFQQREFESIYELKGEWLPARSQKNCESLRLLSETGRYLNSYQNAIQSQQQLQHLQKAADQLQGLQNQFLSKKSDWSIAAAQPLKTWQDWVQSEIQKVEQETSKEIPNPFYYGRPISPEYGTDLFRGREKIARHIEQLLADQQQSLSIALLAPRRCGKSSMLKMLPVMLPDAIFIFYDLQDNTVDSIEGFFRSLVKRVQEQAYQDRGVKIPDLPEGTAFEAGRAWLEQVDKQLNQTMLICIDEFERLPALFPGTEQQLLQLMSLFRATIQHRQHIRLLVSGAAPFDELEQLWNDNFINVQEIKLPHLDYDSSIGLIREPIDSFPKEAIPAELADAIFERSNGQPFLLQAFAGITIEHLNNHELKVATLDMLDHIEEKVMERCSTYFRDVYGNAPKAAKRILQQLSEGKSCKIDKESRRWLMRRLLITEDGEIKIPIFGRWVREFAEEF